MRVDVRGLEVDPEALEGALAPALAHVRRDGILAYPTATVYGFGGRTTPPALAALSALKRRDPERPFLLLIPHDDAVSGLVWTDEARELARAFWPGALTLVLADPHGRYPTGVRGAGGGVAVRRSPHPVVRALVEALGEPLTSTSANLPGAAPASDAAGVARVLEGAGPSGDTVVVVDGGTLPPSPPSTLVDCTGAEPRVLRSGAVPLDRLRCVLPRLSAPSSAPPPPPETRLP